MTCAQVISLATERLRRSTLVRIDAELAELERQRVLSDARLDALPSLSSAWTWELERWVDLVKRIVDLETARREILERECGRASR